MAAFHIWGNRRSIELELVIEQRVVAVFKFLPRDPDCVVLHFSAKRRPPV
jgi:hypothetical protein